MSTNSAIRCYRVTNLLAGCNARPVGTSLSSRPPLVQPKLSLGAVNDQYEREADRIAETVMKMTEPGVVLHQNTSPTINRQPANATNVGEVASSVHQVLASHGQPLDSGTRAYMEPRFGHDFSKVRIHADSKAAESAQSINALAYTVGEDIVFGKGQYASGTSKGQSLLAHELAHSVQQESVPQVFNTSLNISGIGDISECEAETAASNFQLNGLFQKSLAGGLHSTPIQISRQQVDTRIGGPLSRTVPAYTIDDLKRRLAKFNLGPIKGYEVVRDLNKGGWQIAFWSETGKHGLTDPDHNLILLSCEASLMSNVSTLFHEAMHALKRLPGSTGQITNIEAIWANLEEEIMAQYQEILFLQANAATAPGLAESSSYSREWPKIAKMDRRELYRYFKEDAITWIVFGKSIEYRALLEQFDNDVGKLLESPRINKILDRVILGFHPSPLVVPPKHPRTRFPSLIKIRKDFNREISESVEGL